jgi:hypothetical protein
LAQVREAAFKALIERVEKLEAQVEELKSQQIPKKTEEKVSPVKSINKGSK